MASARFSSHVRFDSKFWMIPGAREVRLKPKVRKMVEARCRAPNTAQRDVKRGE
jgi:hypothetical protein